jgi:hypothetical protein
MSGAPLRENGLCKKMAYKVPLKFVLSNVFSQKNQRKTLFFPEFCAPPPSSVKKRFENLRARG